ncbi:MAG: hypothetical protein HC831_21425 [Chloroflexia bacterium]|nr:hypothetical protein [Chloroflexia bacterium]
MYTEQKIKIEENQIKFIKDYKNYGFKSQDELINYAIKFFEENYNLRKDLEISADLYTEIYLSDNESKEWIDSSLNDWK